MLVTLLFTHSAAAQHSDIFLSVVEQQIVVQESFHADSIRQFDVLGDGSVWHGTNPGYATSQPEHFKVNDEISFDVVSPLLFFDETWDVADDTSYLRQFWPVFPDLSVTINATSGNQPGFVIGAAGIRGTLHQHHTFELATVNRDMPSIGAYAIQQVVRAEGYITSDPFWIVFNNGMEVADFATTLRALPAIGVIGDYDRNEVLDLRDINRLGRQIVQGQPPLELTAEFDLNADGWIDDKDLTHWVHGVRQTWIGDANLDGEFNSTDLIVVFQAGHYESEALMETFWQHGDWNGDAVFDTGDLVAAFQDGGYDQGTRAQAVPEPKLPLAVPFFLLVLLNREARRQSGPTRSRVFDDCAEASMC